MRKPNIELRDDAMREVVAIDASLECISSVYGFLEGPVWHHKEKHLTFSDIPNSTMYRLFADGAVTVFRQPTEKANGNAYDSQGRLITCEHASSRVVRQAPGGPIEVLASAYGDTALNSPNDIIASPAGDIYFTDPVFGRREFFGVPRPQQLSFQGVYCLRPDGKLVLLTDDLEQPNGLCLTDDLATLFVNDTPNGHIRRFEVKPGPTLTGGEVWAELAGEGEGVPDGLKIDSEGRVFCTGPGGIHVFDANAECLGVILIPEKCANFTWGDDDLKSLYATASTSLYRIRVLAPGRPAF